MEFLLFPRIAFLLLTVYAAFFFPLLLTGQTQNYLLHPSLYDEYKSFQLLPGGGVRLYVLSNQSNEWVSPSMEYVDYSPDSLLVEPVEVRIDVPGNYINYFADGIWIIRFDRGDAVIGNNFFDCDYGGPGGVYKLNTDGAVEWSHDFLEEGSFSLIEEVAFADSNTIYVGEGDYAVFYDFLGQEISHDIPDTIYEFTIQTPFGYLGGYNDELSIFNHGFNVYKNYLLEGEITSIDPAKPGIYQIKTADKYYVFKEDQQLYYLPFSPSAYPVVWSSQQYYWTYDEEQRSVVKWDTLFDPLDTLPLPPGVVPLSGAVNGGQTLVVCSYNNEISTGVVTFRGDEETLDLDLHQDIGIADIVLNDTVLVEYFDWSVPYAGWVYHIPDVAVVVKNYGIDTISQFYIQGHDLLDCFWWCGYPHPFWFVDSLQLSPGSSDTVWLGSFETRCGNEFNPELCLSTIAPNNKADGDFLNDKFCQAFDTILDVKDLIEEPVLSLYPNPTTDFLYLKGFAPGFENITGSIYTSDGLKIKEFIVPPEFEGIDVSGYTSGMYFLALKDQGGNTNVGKFVIMR